MLLSSLSFSVMFLGVKLYSTVPTFTLIFYRSVVQTALSVAAIMLLQRRRRETGDNSNRSHDGVDGGVRLLLVLRGLFGSLAVAAWFHAVQRLPLPDAVTLQFTAPVFAGLLAATPLLREPFRRSDAVGAAVCLAGVLLIARPSWLFFGGGGRAVEAATAATATTAVSATGIGLAGAVFAGLAYVLVRRIGSRADANAMVLYYAVISAVTAPFGAKFLTGSSSSPGTWNVVGTPSPSDFAAYVGLGVFGFLGQLLANMGLMKCDTAATATLVTNTQIVFAFFFEVVVLRQPLSPWSVAGSLLITGYTACTGLNKIAKEKKKESTT